MKKVGLVSSLVLVLGLSTWGIAQAGSGPNSGGTTPAPTAVAGTSAGMPPTAQVLWAVINADGTEARTFPSAATAVTSAHLGTGGYQVLWTGKNLTGCAYQATIGNAATGTSADGFIQVDARAGQPSGVFIQTRDTAGAVADRPFHLAVTC
jgi:hypothetical protein